MNSMAREFVGLQAVSAPATAAGEGIAHLEPVRAIGPIEAQWREFERSAVGHIFQSVDFVRTWLETVGAERGVQPLFVVGRSRCGRVLCILPFGVRRAFGARQIEWLGAEHADYHCGLFDRDFLAGLAERPERTSTFVAGVVDIIGGEADVVHFHRQPAVLDGMPNPFARYRPLRHAASSHETHLGPCWNSYYRGKRNSGSRRHDRAKLRNLETLGPIRFIDATSAEDIERVMAVLFEQKTQMLSEHGVAGFFASSAVKEFYTALARQAFPRGPSHIAALECGGKIVATNWGLVRGNRYYYVMHSFADGTVSRFSPGRHLMLHLMEWCTQRGIDVFDFTIGDESFKGQWCEKSTPLYDSVATLGLAGLPRALALRSGKPIKRMVKASPAMHAAAQRVRRYLPSGRLRSAV
jgi:CelD/BcsL family acetyltransferase involved in cellulose biosynthesis